MGKKRLKKKNEKKTEFSKILCKTFDENENVLRYFKHIDGQKLN